MAEQGRITDAIHAYSGEEGQKVEAFFFQKQRPFVLGLKERRWSRGRDKKVKDSPFGLH